MYSSDVSLPLSPVAKLRVYAGLVCMNRALSHGELLGSPYDWTWGLQPYHRNVFKRLTRTSHGLNGLLSHAIEGL